LSEAVGGLLMAPQVSSSQVYDVLGNSEFGTKLVDQRQEEGNLELVICSREDDKVSYKTEASSVGSLVGNRLWEGIGDKMEVGGSSLNNLVAEEGAHLDCSLNLQDHFSEGLLLQDKDRDGQGERDVSRW
jgi:hypothetical protein